MCFGRRGSAHFRAFRALCGSKIFRPPSARNPRSEEGDGCVLEGVAALISVRSVHSVVQKSSDHSGHRDEATLSARNRFLLDEFPPRAGASAGDKSVTPPVP